MLDRFITESYRSKTLQYLRWFYSTICKYCSTGVFTLDPDAKASKNLADSLTEDGLLLLPFIS